MAIGTSGADGDSVPSFDGVGFKVLQDFAAHADAGACLEGFGEAFGEVF